KLGAEMEAATKRQRSDEQDLAAGEAAGRNAIKSEAEARTLMEQARSAIADLEKATGQADCPTCGQPLTEAHLDGERQVRASKLKAWSKHFASATQLRQNADQLIQ